MIDSASYMAHGYCLLWKPWLVTLHAASDFLIFAAYFANQPGADFNGSSVVSVQDIFDFLAAYFAGC